MARLTDRPAPGIRRTATGWQVFVRVHGAFHSKRLPPETLLPALKAAREDLRARARLHLASDGPALPGFRADVDTYLTLVKSSLVTYPERAYRLKQWAAVFGDRPRASIKPIEMRVQLEKWRETGRADGGRLSNASLNLRRTDLMALYTALDGRGAPNPVKDVPPQDVSASADVVRSQPIRVWYRLLARIGRRYKTGRRTNLSRVRLRVLLWTGWPPAILMKILSADLDLPHARARVARRRKGKGHPSKWVRLLPPAVTALKLFVEANAWGKFSTSSLRWALQRAWEEENQWRAKRRKKPLPPVTTYHARHSFLTLLATLTTDERAIQDLALHGTPQQTRRYTRGSDEHRQRAAIAEVSGKLGAHLKSERVVK